MALQGNLDTFPLTDVLRLLSSTAKTGCLQVESARGNGAVWLDAGAVVSVEAPGLGESPEPVDALFELLRYPEGTFAFVTDAAAPEPGDGQDVEALLAAAEELVAEWTAVEEVVPSLDLWVSLVEELPTDEVTLDATAWRTITAIGSGGPVRDVGAWLEVSELDACRGVRDLVEAGLAQVTEPPEGAPAPLSAVESEPLVDAWLSEPEPGNYVELPPIPLPDDLAPLPETAPVSAPWQPMDQDRWDEVEREARAAQEAEMAEAAVDEAGVEETPVAPVQQLEELRTSDQDPEPALPDVEAIVEDQPIDRSRLLRFLGSVRN